MGFKSLFWFSFIGLVNSHLFAKDYIVKLKPNVSQASIQGNFRAQNFKVKSGLAKLNMLVVSQSDEQQVKALRRNMGDQIEYIEEDHLVYAVKIPSDTYFSSQSALQRIKAPQAWDIQTGRADIIVAVSDSGIELKHPDLVNQLWVNENEIPGNGIDDDGNGHIDDVHGWNFFDNNNNPNDSQSHGTHVAGIIGAEADNALGVSGVNWDVKLMPIQFIGADGSGPNSASIKTIIYAADNGARILNASWGSNVFSQALKDAIDYANNKGMLVVAAAGNETADVNKTEFFPAGYDARGLISVASSKAQGVLSEFSNYGKTKVDLAAPGSDILSTVPVGGYQQYSGTSMASPMVAGVAALVLAQNPELDVVSLKNAVLNAVTYQPNYEGLLATAGDLDAHRALAQLDQGFQVWPGRMVLAGKDQFQFSAYKPQGAVTWSVNPSGLGTVNAQGLFIAAEHKDGGVVQIAATDSTGATAMTTSVQVLPTANYGGGCTKEAHASDGVTQSSSSPWSAVFYFLIFALYALTRNIFRRN